MKRLYLLRHAKAKRDDIEDSERPLTKRGRADAARLAKWMARHGAVPELVLCSPARRAEETWTLLSARLDHECRLRLLKSLYNATQATLLARIRSVPTSVDSVLVVGHNPGLENLALRLAGAGSNKRAHGRLQKKFPAGAVAAFETDLAGWRDLGDGSARLVALTKPGDLR